MLVVFGFFLLWSTCVYKRLVCHGKSISSKLNILSEKSKLCKCFIIQQVLKYSLVSTIVNKIREFQFHCLWFFFFRPKMKFIVAALLFVGCAYALPAPVLVSQPMYSKLNFRQILPILIENWLWICFWTKSISLFIQHTRLWTHYKNWKFS